jgi:hypothetical protein
LNNWTGGLEYFPRSTPLDTPIERSPETPEQAAGLLSAEELGKFNLRAVPVVNDFA